MSVVRPLAPVHRCIRFFARLFNHERAEFVQASDPVNTYSEDLAEDNRGVWNSSPPRLKNLSLRTSDIGFVSRECAQTEVHGGLIAR